MKFDSMSGKATPRWLKRVITVAAAVNRQAVVVSARIQPSLPWSPPGWDIT